MFPVPGRGDAAFFFIFQLQCRKHKNLKNWFWCIEAPALEF